LPPSPINVTKPENTFDPMSFIPRPIFTSA
jgi:hypothetical protein